MNESSNKQANLFAFLNCGGAVENAFSAGLAYLLASEPDAQEVFLGFVEEQTGVTLEPKTGWLVQTEVERPSGRQKIFVDMVLSQPDGSPIELWFEHKIESNFGEGQLGRYLEAMELAKAEKKVVQLAVISRRRLDLSEVNDFKLSEAASSGVRWCTAEGGCRGFVSWTGLLPAMQAASREWAHTNKMFIDWWAGIPLMLAPEPAKNWSDLIPKQQGGKGPFSETELGDLWYEELQRAKDAGWQLVSKPYKGNPHSFKRGDLTIQVKAFESHEMASATSGVNLAGMRAELLEVALFGHEVEGVDDERGVDEVRGASRQWSVKTTYNPHTGTWIRVLIEVGDMSNVDFTNKAQLAKLLADTFSVGMDVLQKRAPQHFSSSAG